MHLVRIKAMTPILSLNWRHDRLPQQVSGYLVHLVFLDPSFTDSSSCLIPVHLGISI